MDYESFFGAFGDVPTNLAGDYGQLFIFNAEDFGEWYRRVRDAHEREVDGGVDAMTDAELAEHNQLLPVDADGVPIHIGDVVYDCNESPSEKFSVAIMELNKWGWSLLDSYGERNEPGQCHHYRAPTVEDVLREFTEGLGVPVADSYVAAAAAKLRLAGEDA